MPMGAFYVSLLIVLLYNAIGFSCSCFITSAVLPYLRPCIGALAIAASTVCLTFENEKIFNSPRGMGLILNCRIVVTSWTALFFAHRFFWFCRENMAYASLSNLVHFIYESTSPESCLLDGYYGQLPENAAISDLSPIRMVVAFFGLFVMVLGLLCHFKENAASYSVVVDRQHVLTNLPTVATNVLVTMWAYGHSLHCMERVTRSITEVRRIQHDLHTTDDRDDDLQMVVRNDDQKSIEPWWWVSLQSRNAKLWAVQAVLGCACMMPVVLLNCSRDATASATSSTLRDTGRFASGSTIRRRPQLSDVLVSAAQAIPLVTATIGLVCILRAEHRITYHRPSCSSEVVHVEDEDEDCDRDNKNTEEKEQQHQEVEEEEDEGYYSYPAADATATATNATGDNDIGPRAGRKGSRLQKQQKLKEHEYTIAELRLQRNYGDTLFWWSIYCACFPSFTNASEVCLAAVVPLLKFIMVVRTEKRIERTQHDVYKRRNICQES